MDNILTPELIEKAKSANSAKELLSLAKENNYELTAEQANAYFEQISKHGELSDDELENAAGGGCHKDGKLVVSIGYSCDHWRCSGCGVDKNRSFAQDYYQHCCPTTGNTTTFATCNCCKFKSIENGLWLCTNPKNHG